VVAAPSCAVAAARHEFSAPESTQGLLLGQAPRGRVHGVEHAAGHDGLVRVAAVKTHDHFLADAGQVHAAQLAARPAAGHAHPARAVLVFHSSFKKLRLAISCGQCLLEGDITPRKLISFINDYCIPYFHNIFFEFFIFI
jgi:hypothetical protein